MSYRVFLLEDDTDTADTVCAFLELRGIEVAWSSSLSARAFRTRKV